MTLPAAEVWRRARASRGTRSADSGEAVNPEVLVVGAGPTGLVSAILLGSVGIRTLVVERNPATSDEPKAVTIDDVALRTLQRAGIAEAIYPAILPGTGTKYYGRRGQLLAYARGAWPPRHGHPVKNPFQQPEFERALLACARRFGTVEVRFSTAFEALEQDADGVTATLAGGERVRCQFLLGCDGGRSTVRSRLGLAMAGSSFREPWIVIDTVNDRHDQRFAMHHGDPARPHVIVPGRDGCCRYEFLLLPGEAEEDPAFEFVRALLAPFRPIEPRDVIRRTVYTFHALLAERWRVGRCFLLGDAAHMMPPFAGAGLNTGIRDADNLTWKLVMALRGSGGTSLLETYEAERRPYAEAIIRLSVRLGKVMMTTSPWRATIRDLVVAAATRWPRARRYLAEMRFRPEQTCQGGFVVLNGRVPAVGRVLPQPHVLGGDGREVPLDDILGPGFALLAIDPAADDPFTSLTHPLWERIGASRLAIVLGDRAPERDLRHVADLDGRLAAFLGTGSRFVLIRPDRFVAAAFGAGDEGHVATQLGELLGGPVPAACHSRPPLAARGL
jgi:3-(3-hydroxy-phenyl)propionate hydroxylase